MLTTVYVVWGVDSEMVVCAFLYSD